MPDFQSLSMGVREIDDWYASYVENMPESDLDQSVDLVFTNGARTRMRRSEIILHVCLHGTYRAMRASFFK